MPLLRNRDQTVRSNPMSPTCHQCPEIIKQLQREDQSQAARCPLCNRRYVKGRQWVLDEEGFIVNEIWEKSDRPAYCTLCNWAGPMRSTAFRVDDCFPHRCPMCGAVVANRKGGSDIVYIDESRKRPIFPLSGRPIIKNVQRPYIIQ